MSLSYLAHEARKAKRCDLGLFKFVKPSDSETNNAREQDADKLMRITVRRMVYNRKPAQVFFISVISQTSEHSPQQP